MRVYVESFGCTQNLGEGRAIERALHDAGHAISPTPEGADAGVLVTCAVIGPTESRMVRRWEWLGQRVPKVVVTGCLVPLRSGLLQGPGRDRTTLVAIRDQHRIPEILSGPAPAPSDARPAPVERLPRPAVATAEIAIAQGCTSACTYCFSRLARGPLASLPVSEVVRKVRDAVAAGAAEIRLSALDTSAYGHDLESGERLPELLGAVETVPGPHRVRIGMMSPQTLAPIAERYFDRLAHEPFFRFLHLPVQSGSDGVLGAMRRGHDAATFWRLVDLGRRKVPELALSTDVIVGFPTETEADFRRTLELLDATEPEIVNVTRFSARPMTPAARLKPLGPRVAKDRSRRVADLRWRLARRRLERWVGRRSDAIAVEAGAGGTTVARLPNYLPVVLPGRLALGARFEVRIDGARTTYLLGRPTGGFGPPGSVPVP